MSDVVAIVAPSHVIGVGASAGGLEALQLLLQHLPPDTGASFVVIQHLSPDFKSMMLELLSKHTGMAMYTASDGMAVEADSIYLLPPKKTMMIKKGVLRLTEKVFDSGLSLPIDMFFRSLADDQQDKAIGIILSGTGSDGSRGVKALKEAGGLVIVQSPNSAKFDGMPTSAINTGAIDLVLRPEEMGAKLNAYIQHPLVTGDLRLLSEISQRKLDEASGTSVTMDVMEEIFGVLKSKTDIDFSNYKPSTVARRIERRMTIRQVTELRDYLSVLFREPYEVQVLSRELLIGVTRFFRDGQAFALLREKIVPDIIKRSKPEEPIRVWVSACSSGEEAYSIAILFRDELKAQQVNRSVKIFATDVNSDSVVDASLGIYNEEIQHDLTETQLNENFSPTSCGRFQIKKEIRQMVIFAAHNLIMDPPFSNMDLVSCRNVLIYFQQEIQKKALLSLHFSLRKEGYLFLGSSENLGELNVCFDVISDRHRVYKKRIGVRLPWSDSAITNRVENGPVSAMQPVNRLLSRYRGQSVNGCPVQFANDLLINRFAPPSILLSEVFEALHVYGDVTPFMRRLPPGRISVDIQDMVNEDLGIAVSSATYRAKQSGEEVLYTDVFTQSHEGLISLNLRVMYFREREVAASPGFYWVIFERTEISNDANVVNPVTFDASAHSRQRIADLELELKRKREHLQVTVEELETTNEELQSSNEELMSSNEELQSTNEELQSVNEELHTVNAEYQDKMLEVSRINRDMDEVLALTKFGIIFLDENKLIRRYTKAAAEYVNLRHSDIDRPLYHISRNIPYESMNLDLDHVYLTGQKIEREVIMPDHRVLQVTMSPYRYADGDENYGAVLTFADITEPKKAKTSWHVHYDQLYKNICQALEALESIPMQDHLSVLVAGCADADFDLIETALSQLERIEIERAFVTSQRAFEECFEERRFDVVLVMYNQSCSFTPGLIQELSRYANHMPFVVIAKDGNESVITLLRSLGVVDFINATEVTPQLLSKCISFAMRRRQIEAEVKSAIRRTRDG